MTLFFACGAVIVSCSGPPTPEERIRAALERGSGAVRDHDASEVCELVSERYRDGRGHGKREVEALIRYYFLQNDSIHLLTRVRRIAVTEPGKAEVTLLVALAGLPIPDLERLDELHADLLRFDLIFVEESPGEWKVVEADWRGISAGDFP